MTTNFAISALLTVYHISRLDTMCFVPPVSVPGVFIVNPLETLLLTICLPLRYTRAQMPCKFLTEGNSIL